MGTASLERAEDGIGDALDAASDLRAALAACAAFRADADESRAALAPVESKLGALAGAMESAPRAHPLDE